MFDYDSNSYSTVRFSKDTHVNNFGRRMTETCKSFGSRICNGRKPGDAHGRLTFYNHLGSRVIGYAVVAYELYTYVIDFKVLQFNEWSDHAPIYLSFNNCLKEKQRENIHDSNGVCDTVNFYRWNQ